MARVTTVKKSQKETACEKCGKALPKGSSYKWCAPRAGSFTSGRKRIRCLDCPGWRPSEVTSSSHLATLYGAQEAFDDFLSEWDGEDADALRGAISSFAEGVREASDSYGESAQNIEDGFQHETSMSQELREKSESLSSWADEIEAAESEITDFDEAEARSTAEEEVLADQDYEADPGETEEQRTERLKPFAAEIEEKIKAAREEWSEAQSGVAEGVKDNCPL